MHAIVDAVPMVMQWPLERDMHPSALPELVWGHAARFEVALELPDVGPRAEVLPLVLAGQHRARR